MMITINVAINTRRIVNFLSANSQTGITRPTSGGLREGRISLLERGGCSFFVRFLRPLVFQFNISSRNSAQKAGGRLYDLAHNSRIREEKRKDSGQVGKLPPTDLHFLESWEDERRTLERESVHNFSRALVNRK